MAHLTVDKENSTSVEIYYEDHGTASEKNPVVLIHGWPLSGRAWESQLSPLLHAGHRVITYDRRGFGESSKPSTGYEYDTLAKDLHTLLSKLDLKDVTLAGFSMGGGEVARYLSTYGSGRVRSAIFLGAIPPFLLKTADNPQGIDGKVFDDIQAGIRKDRPAFLTQFLSNFFNTDKFEGKQISSETIRMCWNIASMASPIACHDCVRAWLTDFREDLKKIDVPSLVIHGDDDRIVPFDISGQQTQKQIKDCKISVVKGGPHGFTSTHANEVNETMLGFLGIRT